MGQGIQDKSILTGWSSNSIGVIVQAKRYMQTQLLHTGTKSKATTLGQFHGGVPYLYIKASPFLFPSLGGASGPSFRALGIIWHR